MDNNFDRSRIDSLQQKLYSRKHGGEPDDERTPISKTDFSVSESWEEKTNLNNLLMQERNVKEVKKGTIYKKILIGSVCFFIFAAGVAAYLFFGGLNSVSGNNIDIQIVGPLFNAEKK